MEKIEIKLNIGVLVEVVDVIVGLFVLFDFFNVVNVF